MRKLKLPVLAAVLASALFGALTVGGLATKAEAGLFAYRQYYSGWSYYPQRTYYLRSYYYKPYPTYATYKYHYCIYYPARPRYVYYYNPYRKLYWGRYDLEKGGYSQLAEKDRKAKLDEIPETAFPAPGAMPAVPESNDGETIQKIAAEDLPNAKTLEDLPAGASAPK